MSTGPNRVLIIVVAVIAAVALAAGVLSATRGPQQYDRGTPEGVVQAYAEALIDRDQERAADLLVEDSPCTLEDLDRATLSDDTRVILRDAQTKGDGASVDVEVVVGSEGPFGFDEWSEEHTLRLSREAEGWRITGAPWPLFECGGRR